MLVPLATNAHLSVSSAKMKFATRSSVSFAALSALVTVAQAEDALYSKRMAKRGIDADGNYNICKSALYTTGHVSAHAA